MISDAMTYPSAGKEASLWNAQDGYVQFLPLSVTSVDLAVSFYYDAISWGGPWSKQLPVRSLVGLIPLYAVLTLEPELIDKFPSFKRRLQWFIDNRNDVAERNMSSLKSRGKEDRLLLSLVNKDRLVQILKRMLDESEFLSEHGIRSLSKYHKDHPYSMVVNGQEFKVGYVPGDSDSGLFGGNSNWRGNSDPEEWRGLELTLCRSHLVRGQYVTGRVTAPLSLVLRRLVASGVPHRVR